jgi:hypothetical protein
MGFVDQDEGWTRTIPHPCSILIGKGYRKHVDVPCTRHHAKRTTALISTQWPDLIKVRVPLIEGVGAGSTLTLVRTVLGSDEPIHRVASPFRTRFVPERRERRKDLRCSMT